ncbi:MAG TPA: tetratricopeptide repeat protein [Polyangia bacterium]
MSHPLDPSPHHSPQLGAARLFRELAEAQDAALRADENADSSGAHAGLRATGTFTVARRPGATRMRRRLGLLPVALGLGVAAATLIVVATTRKPSLHVQLGASTKDEDAIPTLVADARNDLPLRFSDGSTITFQAGSSGKLQQLTNAGAEMVLARGTLRAHVIHAAETSWIIHAGPYRVRVTGTRFGLSWQAERLELSLYEGSVVVDGALLGSGVPVRAGHRLTVASGVVRIEPMGATAVAPTARERTLALAAPAASPGAPAKAVAETPDSDEPALEPRPEREPSGVHSAAAGPRARPSRGGAASASRDEEWLALADRGSYREALDVAKRIGWWSLCRRLDARRLLTLADVARYSDARVPAHRAFEALVHRFPNDRLAADAVFSLGRLAFEGGRPTEAARWFRRYVSDWPRGPLAEQAAGRLLESTIRMQDTDAARGAARAYLARAPHGAQASLARGVLADPSDGSP